MPAIILHKTPAEARDHSLDYVTFLNPGEVLVSAAIGLNAPAGLTATLNGAANTAVGITLTGGVEGVTYGVRVDATTSIGRVISATLAMLVSTDVGTLYNIRNPDAIQTLVDEIQAGESALGNAMFMFPADAQLAGGFVTWELLATADGRVYANGNAFDFSITNTGLAVRGEGQALITVPSNVPQNLQGNKYQIRWTLTLPDGSTYFTFENVRVTSPNTVPLGVEDAVEFAGDVARLGIVLPKTFDHVGLEIYTQVGSIKLASFMEVSERQLVADGYYCAMYLDTAILEVTLHNYVVVWKYWNDSRPNEVFRETGRLFLLNASIMAACDDLKRLINKSHATITNEPDLLFPMPTLLAFLRMGRDHFNGAFGMLTNFDMTDASSSIRQFWLMYSSVIALRSQYIAEGEKAFNMAGQSITLDVDRTQYYDSAATAFQSQIDNEAKAFKQNLIKKGIISGTGNLESIGLRMGAIGSVGIGISPASSFGRYYGRYPNRFNS